MSSLRRPATSEHAPYFSRYIDLVPDGDVLALLEKQLKETESLLRSISEKQSEHRYAPEKWSIREVVGHISDAERVFVYRALRAVRKDPAELPGFDENTWAANSNAHRRTMASLIDEFRAVRLATLATYRGFEDASWANSVIASKNPISARAAAYVTAGHELHHVKILREKYLNS